MTTLHRAEYAPHLYEGMNTPYIHSEYGTILSAIDRCDVPARLRQWIFNSHKRNTSEVRNASFRRLAQIADKTSEDTFDNTALRVLAVYRTRLTASRCIKVNMTKYQATLRADGPVALLEAMSERRKFREISKTLVEMDLADLTMEAAIIRFRSKFSKNSVDAARTRLADYGFNGRF